MAIFYFQHGGNFNKTYMAISYTFLHYNRIRWQHQHNRVGNYIHFIFVANIRYTCAILVSQTFFSSLFTWTLPPSIHPISAATGQACYRLLFFRWSGEFQQMDGRPHKSGMPHGGNSPCFFHTCFPHSCSIFVLIFYFKFFLLFWNALSNLLFPFFPSLLFCAFLIRWGVISKI